MVMIGITLAAVTTATVAYFSNTQSINGNTFATGTVLLDKTLISGLPINMTNMAPGITQTIPVGFQYKGSLNADIYIGVTGYAHDPSDGNYFGSVTKLVINDGTTDIYDNYVSGLSTAWLKIANNVTPDQWKYYTLAFTMDSATGNEKMGQTNTDTVIKLYAVQTGGGAPATPPFP